MSTLAYPTGKYEIITDNTVLSNIYFDKAHEYHIINGRKAIGVAHAQIQTPAELNIPLFGISVKDGYNYGNCSLCIKKKSQKKCKHGPKARSILVTACWNELDFAVSIGYKIDRVFECYVYANEAPIFSKFFSLLSREKIMYSEPEGNDLQKYVNDINAKMNYSPEMCLTTQDIKPNQLMRQYCKQDLVMLFGKLSQQNMRTKPIVIKSQQELENVTLNTVEDVFGMEKACVLIAKNSSLHSRHNRKANSFLYAYVLAYSRIYMYKTMNQIVKRNGHIYQISNDALYFSCPSNIKLSEKVLKFLKQPELFFTFGK